MSRLNTTAVSNLLTYYRDTYTRARAVGQLVAPGDNPYASSFENITWTSVSTGTDGSGRATGNINLSTPLEWTITHGGVDISITHIEIYTSGSNTPVARYALDTTRTFSATGTLRIDTLPTNLNSTQAS